MDLYTFLSIIIAAITIIICFIICNITDISQYYKYKNAYYELDEAKLEYDNYIKKCTNDLNNLNYKFDNLEIVNDKYVESMSKLTTVIFNINKVVYANYECSTAITKIKDLINNINLK